MPIGADSFTSSNKYIVELIKATGKIDEYLIGENIRNLALYHDDIIELIKETKNIDEYLTEAKRDDLNLSDYDIIELIKATNKIDEYLTKKKRDNLKLSNYVIINLIEKTGKIDEYLTEAKRDEFGFDSDDVTQLIIRTKNIEKYLTLDKIKEFELHNNHIATLIKATKNIEKYLLEGQKDRDFFTILNVMKGTQENEKFVKRMEDLLKKNENINKTLTNDFMQTMLNETYELTDEQVLRITNYAYVQDFLVSIAENKIMKDSVNYLIKNDDNWIININRIIENKENYEDLIKNLKNINIDNIDNKEEFNNQLLCVLSDTDNYFDINNVNDINGYFDKKKEICLKILKGEITEEEIPESFKEKYYSKEDLYKFALLEYKLGISLEETKRLVFRYAEDIEKINKIVQTNSELNKYSTVSQYFYTLKTILNCENIEEIIKNAIKENTLGVPLNVSVNSRNIEAQMLNLFAEIYNETLYQPKEEDKDEKQETYTEEKDGTQIEHKIDVYNLTDDFNINVRIEGAYSYFKEPNNFKEFYNQPNIDYHGNCESYIGNDSISVAKNINGVAVGYKIIRENCLAGSAPYDLWSDNKIFSIFNEGNEGNYGKNEKSQFLLPKSMIDNTRHGHNEMIKERLIDENGEAIKYEPDYAVWVEETPVEDRIGNWKENDEKWIRTKKLAAQLGIPIIVIDREYYAQREEKKVDILKDLILGKDVNLNEEENKPYKSFIDEYKNLSRPELIKELFTKYENNRIGLQYNENLRNKYFTTKKLGKIVEDIQEYIEKLSVEEKKESLQAMNEVAFKERDAIEIKDNDDDALKKMKNEMIEFYDGLTSQCQENLLKIDEQEQSKQQTQKSESETITQNKPDYINIIEQISKSNFYEGNEQHSIEHIQKVILFSELLAQEEEIPEEDKKLLLVAAAYHDSGRQGLGDGNIPHAVASAEKAGNILRGIQDGPTFGITNKNDIAIIQTAIAYHERQDKEDGKVNEKDIETLINQYAIDNNVTINEQDIKRTITICKILKDADALDRYRFAQHGKLDPKFLRTKTAKNVSVQAYAKNINEMVARKILEETCKVSPEDIKIGNAVESLKGEYAITYDRKILAIYGIDDIELAKRCGIDDISKIDEIENGKDKVYKQLVQARSKNIANGCPQNEGHLDFTDIYNIPFPEIQKEEENQLENNNENNNELSRLLEFYKDDELIHENMNEALKTLQQTQQVQNIINEQSNDEQNNDEQNNDEQNNDEQEQ